MSELNKRIDELTGTSSHVFQGFDGIPFRGNKVPPLLKQEDRVQPEVVVDAKVRVLDLTKEEDQKFYEFIWDQVAKGRFTAPVEDRQYDHRIHGWRVLIRFGVRWLEMPK
jgi:hypothetical protein